jgi:hypothetical protein
MSKLVAVNHELPPAPPQPMEPGTGRFGPASQPPWTKAVPVTTLPCSISPSWLRVDELTGSAVRHQRQQQQQQQE